jgi:predicted  nucleic acid-binding Zn-ribbon protein
MTMDEVFEKMRQLQDVLSQKIALEKQVVEIPEVLSTQEELLLRLKTGFVETNTRFEQTRTLEKKSRETLAQAEADSEKAEKNMDAVNTQREYEALDSEIRSAAKREQEARKDLQKHERVIVELDEKLKQSQALIQQQEDDLAKNRAGIEKEVNKKNAEIKKLTLEEATLSEGIDADVLFKFERIIKNKMGKGIVAIKGGVCTGCHMILPVQFANDVRLGREIVFCPYCSRILYYEEIGETETSFLDEELLGSFTDMDDMDDPEEEEEEEEGMDVEE